MSRHVFVPGWFAPAAVAVLVVLMSSLAPALGQATTTAPTTAPATAPEPLVDNPHYLAWAKFKPGTAVDLDMNMSVGGQQVTTSITMTLQEISPERAVVQSVAKMNVPGLPSAQEQKQTHTFNAKVPQSEADHALLPPGGTGETKDAGTETIEVAGKTYQIQVREFNGTVQGQPAKGKTWRTEQVPGGLVKMESSSGQMKVEMVLKKVTEK